MKKSKNKGPIFWSNSDRMSIVSHIYYILKDSIDGYTNAAEAFNDAQTEVFKFRPHLRRSITSASVSGIVRPPTMKKALLNKGIVFTSGNLWLQTEEETEKDDFTKLIEHIDKRFEELQATLLGELRKAINKQPID